MKKKKLTPKQMQIARVHLHEIRLRVLTLKSSKRARKVEKHDDVPKKNMVCSLE